MFLSIDSTVMYLLPITNKAKLCENYGSYDYVKKKLPLITHLPVFDTQAFIFRVMLKFILIN